MWIETIVTPNRAGGERRQPGVLLSCYATRYGLLSVRILYDRASCRVSVSGGYGFNLHERDCGTMYTPIRHS